MNIEMPVVNERIALVVEYDGSSFCGWQRQLDQPSIQEALEYASEMFDSLTNVLGLLYDRKEEDNLDAEIEALIEQRQQARKDRNFARADEIRDELLAKGIVLEDTREGVRWKRA